MWIVALLSTASLCNCLWGHFLPVQSVHKHICLTDDKPSLTLSLFLSPVSLSLSYSDDNQALLEEIDDSIPSTGRSHCRSSLDRIMTSTRTLFKGNIAVSECGQSEILILKLQHCDLALVMRWSIKSRLNIYFYCETIQSGSNGGCVSYNSSRFNSNWPNPLTKLKEVVSWKLPLIKAKYEINTLALFQ